jgi:hypothetical protein
MRVFVFILALLGAVACGGLGVLHYTTTLASDNFQLHKQKDPEGANKCIYMIYSLMGAAGVAAVGGVLALNRKRLAAVLVLLVSGAVPLGMMYLAYQTGILIDTVPIVVGCAASPLLLGSLLSLLIRPKPPRQKPGADEETDFEEQEDEEQEQEEQQEEFQDEEEEVQEEEVEEEAPPPPPPAAQPVAKVKCPKCATVLKIPDPQSEKPIRCPKCKVAFRIPQTIVEKARADARIAAKPKGKPR